MIDLSKYKPIEIRENRDLKMSVTNYGVTFGKGVTEALDGCQYCEVLINPIDERLLVMKSSKGEKYALEFCPKGKEKTVRFTSRNLICKISGLMKWDLTINSYRVIGTFIPDIKGSFQPGIVGVLFDLKQAVVMR